MEFNLIKKAGDPDKGTPDVVEVILTTHHRGEADTTPLRMVSAEQVTYWMRIEAEYLRLLEQLAEVVGK